MSRAEISYTEEVEVGRIDEVNVNQAVNEVLNLLASAIYTNNINADNAIHAIEDQKGALSVESIELGASLEFGLKGKDGGNIGGSLSAGVGIKVNSKEEAKTAKQNANASVIAAARTRLRTIKTVVTGSEGKETYLTRKEINGLIDYAVREATTLSNQDSKDNHDGVKKMDHVTVTVSPLIILPSKTMQDEDD